MSAPPESKRQPSMRYRNAVAGLVIGGIVGTLALLYALSLPGAAGAAGALCTVGFLFIAFVGWEYLMKPGYGLLHRRPDLEPPEEREGEPPSSRAP